MNGKAYFMLSKKVTQTIVLLSDRDMVKLGLNVI